MEPTTPTEDRGVVIPGQPKIFSDAMVARLRTMTAAERALREMGYRPAWGALAGPRPSIRVELLPGQSVATLLDRLDDKVIRPDHEGKLILAGRFAGCDVSVVVPQ